MKDRQLYLTVLCLLFLTLGMTQELAYQGNPDDSFFKARDLAFGGERNSARDTLHYILTKYPDNTDVRSLLAKTYSWDGNYNEARKHFNRITSVERENKEVWIAAVKNEIYAENRSTALGLVNKALLYLDNDTDLKSLRSQILADSNKDNNQPNLEEIKAAADSLETGVFKNQIGVINSFDVFDVVYDPMFYSGIEYIRETDAGKIIPRINYSNRFQIHGVQYEMDFHPKLSKTFYGYMNYGFSNSEIYPNHRMGAELYSNLPKSMEASLGMRYLDFRDSKATILTGSFGLYKGNYYFSIRPYVTPRSNDPTSYSGTLMARKYLKDGENFLGVNMGIGFSPELRQLYADDTILAETLLFVESQQVFFEYQFTGKNDPNIYRATLGLTRQEFIFDSGSFFWAVSAGIRYHVKF